MKIATTSRHWLVLAAVGAGELVCTAIAAGFVSRDDTYPIFLSAYLGMGLFWIVGCYYVLRPERPVPESRGFIFAILGVGLMMRAFMLPTEPILSDDIFRYVWDGRMQHAGVNPYAYPPDAPDLRGFRDRPGSEPSIYAGINNKEIPTIYPPFMQMAFYAATAVSSNVHWMKLFFVGADLAIAFVVMGLLGSLGRNKARILIYAWSPLVIVEVAGSGHNDALAVTCLMAALLAIVQHRDRLAMGLLALSGLGKLLGFALLPLFTRALRWRTFLIVPLVTVAMSLPYASVGADAFKGLTEYGLRWRGNDSLFHVLFFLTGSLDHAKVVVGVALIVLVLGLVALDAAPIRGSYITIGAVLLLMPTVHPWYLLWMAPFLAIYASPAWLLLMITVGLSYHSAYLGNPGQAWEDTLWVKGLEYVPFFALLVLGAWRRVRGRSLSAKTLLGLHSPP